MKQTHLTDHQRVLILLFEMFDIAWVSRSSKVGSAFPDTRRLNKAVDKLIGAGYVEIIKIGGRTALIPKAGICDYVDSLYREHTDEYRELLAGLFRGED